MESDHQNPTPIYTNNREYKVSVSETVSFLRLLWDYASLDANCYSIVIIGDKTRFKHFCLSEYGDYVKLFEGLKSYLERRKIEEGEHVYYQVLPLASKPEKGRGSAKDVKVGKWLWCDLDYKEVVDKPGFKGCRELGDYALECYYREGDKWVKVSRPELSRVVESVKNKLGVEPTIVVDSGGGYHLYLKLKYEVEATKIRQLEEKLIDLLGGDPQSKDLARILRLPGSVNPRVSRPVKVVYESANEIAPEELEARLLRKEEMREVLRPETERLRELNDTEVLKISELLKEAYKPGHRQLLLLYLSGWLAKAGVSPISAVKIAKALYEATQDNDPLKTRLSAVVYSYKKVGVAIDSYGNEIESLTGVRPYGLEKEIQEDKVKGVSGIQELLESVLGEERALAIIHELSDMLNVLSPYRDSIIELLDYEKQIYAVANPRKLVIVRARKEGNKLVYKERVAVVSPTKVVVYDSPIGGVRKYEVVFEGATLRKPLIVGPALIDEIADRLRVEGLVYHTRLLNDVLNAIIQAYIRKGRAEIKAEIENPGFYQIDNKIVAVKYDVRPVDKDKLKQALELLNELANVWFKHAQERFATVVKWGAIAPFSYILKLRGVMQKHLYLHGDPDTGKTTLGLIVLSMWGLCPDYEKFDSKSEKSGTQIDTVARLGHVVSSSTFPALINEPGGALEKTDIIEMIKSISESPIARGKYVKGSYVEYPALAPLIFTSNTFYPTDEALLKRLIFMNFSYGEKIPPERIQEFEKSVKPRLHILREIGNCIANWVIRNGLPQIDKELLAREMLGVCYESVGLEKPEWLNLDYQGRENPEVTIIEEFVERLKKLVNDLYARYVSKIVIEMDTSRSILPTPETDIPQRLRILLEKDMIPGMKLKNDKVLILTTLLKEIGLGDRISLKSLAEMLGLEYKVERFGDKTFKTVVTPLEKFEKLITSTLFE